jgi:alpha-L-fucosidase
LYHSLPDWHHPNYVIDERHPLRAKPEFKDCRTPFERNPEIYTKYLRSQVEELLVNYGKIDIIWFDSVYPETEKYFDCRRLNDMIRKLQPGILINRLPGFSDFHSPEQSIPANGVRDDGGRLLRWEGCQVISEYAWGYLRNGQTVKKNGEILQMLVRHVSRGGNLLLNIAPTSRGAIDRRSEHLLLDIGEWMRWHSRSIHNCTVAPEEFPEPEGCRYTWNPERRCLYLHMFVWPDRRIILPKLAGKVEYAQLLCDGSEILLTEHMPGNINCSKVPPGDLMLSLPVARPDTELPVIELFLKS